MTDVTHRDAETLADDRVGPSGRITDHDRPVDEGPIAPRIGAGVVRARVRSARPATAPRRRGSSRARTNGGTVPSGRRHRGRPACRMPGTGARIHRDAGTRGSARHPRCPSTSTPSGQSSVRTSRPPSAAFDSTCCELDAQLAPNRRLPTVGGHHDARRLLGTVAVELVGHRRRWAGRRRRHHRRRAPRWHPSPSRAATTPRTPAGGRC